MSFIKIGETVAITSSDIKDTNIVLADLDISVLDQFTKTAAELKKIAPKAKDFLYFTAIMMHAAESSLINDDGSFKKDSHGNEITAKWDIDEKTGAWKWICSDTNIRPLKNSNGDIFPEAELKLAYKKWIGKPLCIDHKSSSVDHVRGVIVDTYYDDKFKRIVALCALDKLNYPDLARKVSTGVSDSVSMGTAVKTSICSESGCHRVARTEGDFCTHMKNKSGYGEINVGLEPLELSIINVGADGRAKVKSIIASANAISKYIDTKELLLPQILASTDFDKLEKDLEKIHESFSKLKEDISELKEKSEDNESEDTEDSNDAGVYNMAQTDLENTDRNYNMPARFAEDNTDLEPTDRKLIFAKLDGLEEKINNFINKMASIEKAKDFNKETNMTNEKKAYFQGGGDVNEPTPGKPKYTKEDSDKIRDKEDKQLNGQMDTGPVDGIHPGYDSFGESEINRKKRLLRAEEVAARALRRKEALEAAKNTLLQKESYFMGGGDVNEPTPGKPKYTKEDSDKIRDKEDKQQTGAPPFPGVGKIDGLYGDDLKEKETLHRAKLNARFIKAANPDGTDNIKNSGWHVFSKSTAGEKLILMASVSDIAGEKAEALYDSIATKEFGKKIIATIKEQGYEKAVKMFKGAQEHLNHLEGLTPGAQPTKEEIDAAEGYAILHNGTYPPEFVKKYPTYHAGMKATAQMAAPAMPASQPALPVDSGIAPSIPGDEKAKTEDKGSDGSPVDQIDSQLSEIDNITADMKKALEALKDEDTSDLSKLTPVSASSVSLPEMRKTLNMALQKGIKQAIAELEDNKEEFQLIKSVRKNAAYSNNELVKNIVTAALNDAKTTTANVYKLMSAFVKYARGTDALVKKAAEKAKMNKSAQEANDPHDWKKVLDDLHKVNPAKPAPGTEFPGKAAPQPVTPGMKPIFEVNDGEEDKNDVVNFEMGDDGKIKGTADSLADVKASNEYDLNTPEGRALMRAKVAQKGLKFSDMLGKAHPKGGVMVPGLDTKPAGDLAKIEDLEEIHDKMMDSAGIVTPKVRKDAEAIQKLVIAGKIDPEKDFDGLIAEGLDSAAVSYWKKFYGEAKDGGSQFATELVKNYESKKTAELEKVLQVKVARAYELAHDMADRGLIAGNHEAIKEQVNEILSYNDESFNSLKKVVARQNPINKTAAHLPVVGYQQESIIGSPNLTLPGVSSSGDDLKNQLAAAFNIPGKRY